MLENRLRRGIYKKNLETEFFQKQLNQGLAGLNKKLLKLYGGEQAHPIILVIGLPRSGTTLMIQALINSFRIGYINNLIARFWETPLVGIYLSKILLKDALVGYQSSHGKTPEIHGPHEFSYFWHEWLNISAAKEINRDWYTTNAIDWAGLQATLSGMVNLWDRPLLMKGLYPAYYLQGFAERMDTRVVYLKRNLTDTALSILEARKVYYGDADGWWSVKPLEFPQIKDFPPFRQVAAQAFYLNQFYDKQMAMLPKEHVWEIGYEALCGKLRLKPHRYREHPEFAKMQRELSWMTDRFP